MISRPDVTWFRSLHYGGQHVCLWWMVFPDTSMHVKAELVKPSGLIADLARDIRLKTKALRIELVSYTAALKAQMVGTQTSDDDGETRADTFRHNGIRIRQIAFDDLQGWTRVGELLGSRPDGRPWLTIDPSCVALIRSLTNAVSDPSDPENVLDSPTDQPLRALRVGAMSRPSPKPFEKPPLPKKAVGHLVNEIRNGPIRSRLTWK
jgi:hypothetical protein